MGRHEVEAGPRTATASALKWYEMETMGVSVDAGRLPSSRVEKGNWCLPRRRDVGWARNCQFLSSVTLVWQSAQWLWKGFFWVTCMVRLAVKLSTSMAS